MLTRGGESFGFTAKNVSFFGIRPALTLGTTIF
jgi:hypothetical protein